LSRGGLVSSSGSPHFFSDAPGGVILAVLETAVAVQKWFSHQLHDTLPDFSLGLEVDRSAPNRISNVKPALLLAISRGTHIKIAEI